MPEYIFSGKYDSELGSVKVKILLIHFIDDDGIHIVYSPHLDQSGYGKTYKEAQASFKIACGDFIDYTMKKKTLGKVLSELGWKIKGTIRRPKKISVPDMSHVIRENHYVSEIFDKYTSVNTYQQELGIQVLRHLKMDKNEFFNIMDTL